MSLTIESLGLTEEQLQDRVVETMADRLLTQLACDEDGDETYAPSSMQKKLKELCEIRIAEAISKTAEQHVLPRVDEIISTFAIRETNRWGEKIDSKKAMTFTEFLVAKAEAYMQEKVDYNGKSKSEVDSYSWSGKQTRLTHAIHGHLHNEIETAMKQVIGDGTTQIAKALHETCRVKINEIAAKLRVEVTTGR